MEKSAILFGATGLVGSSVLKLLLDDSRYYQVHIYVRRATGMKHSKLQEHVIDFEKLDHYRRSIKADDVFCCLGTTIRTAGSQEAFRRVDFEWVRWCAIAASENGVKNFLVISSYGADENSGNFYYRTKGEMEKAVSALPFEKCVILRPSMLLGPRQEFRLGEIVGKNLMRAFGFLLSTRLKPIHAETVARAMVAAANDPSIKGVLENEKLLTLGE